MTATGFGAQFAYVDARVLVFGPVDPTHGAESEDRFMWVDDLPLIEDKVQAQHMAGEVVEALHKKRLVVSVAKVNMV